MTLIWEDQPIGPGLKKCLRNMLKEWTNRNLSTFKQDKRKALHLGMNKRYKLGQLTS